MLVWKKILWLRERVREQRAWIDRCGGDPDTPPLDQDGNPQVIHLPYEMDADDFGLTIVPDVPNTFYKPHVGDGGTAIYQADLSRLHDWQRQLSDLEVRNYSARVKADEMAATN